MTRRDLSAWLRSSRTTTIVFMRCWAQSNCRRANAATSGLVTAVFRWTAATTRLIEPIAPRMDSSGRCVVLMKAVGGARAGVEMAGLDRRRRATNDKFYRALASAAQHGAGAGAADAEGWNLQFPKPSPRTSCLVFPVLVLPGYIVPASLGKANAMRSELSVNVCPAGTTMESGTSSWACVCVCVCRDWGLSGLETRGRSGGRQQDGYLARCQGWL